MELKPIIWLYKGSMRYIGYDWTIMELKQHFVQISIRHHDTLVWLNHYGIETSFQSSLVRHSRYDWTIMELKLRWSSIILCINTTWGMIEPLWNWNFKWLIKHGISYFQVWLNHYGIETLQLWYCTHNCIMSVWLNHYGIETI